MNSIRLGTYQTIDNYSYNRNASGTQYLCNIIFLFFFLKFAGELNPLLCVFWAGEFRIQNEYICKQL